MILTHWVKILPKPIFFDLLKATLESLSGLGTPQAVAIGNEGVQSLSLTQIEQVLVFEHCIVVHEMLKEIHFWVDKADQIKNGTSA